MTKILKGGNNYGNFKNYFMYIFSWEDSSCKRHRDGFNTIFGNLII